MAEDTPPHPYASNVSTPNPNPSGANRKLTILLIVNPGIAEFRILDLLYRWFTASVSDNRDVRESAGSALELRRGTDLDGAPSPTLLSLVDWYRKSASIL
jgi:hypothetical protein